MVTTDHRAQEGLPLEVRRPHFHWEETPRHWVPDDPFTTHFANVLHLLLPGGERWFVEVVREAAPLVDDEELQEAIKPFMGQEAWHARAHALVLDHLAAQGIDTEEYVERLDGLFLQALSPHDSWPAPLRSWWLRERLAIVAALEHFTCVMGRWVLEHDGLDRAGADPMMLALLRWHASEEVEHRSLVFDVHRAVGGNQLQRALTMLATAPSLFLAWTLGVRYLMRHDPSVEKGPTLGDWLRATRQQRTFGPGILLSALRYMLPGHHPSTEAPTSLGLDYLDHSQIIRDLLAA